MNILLIIYLVGYLIAIRIIGRDSWVEGSRDWKPHNLFASLATGIIIGSIWPIILFVFGIISMADWLNNHQGKCTEAVGNLIFGKDKRK